MPGSATVTSLAKGSDRGEFFEHGLDPELSLRITFRKIGAGLKNLGNTCFLNSVLQCLTYTEPFAAYLQSGKHKSSCNTAGFCAMCALQNHVMDALQSTGEILSPRHFVTNLQCISRDFCISRQEDAHEYMVNLLESMHRCCLPSGVPSESSTAYEKSLVHKIFGGLLRSQVKCMQCSYCSNKFDPFLDLSLEIAKADSLPKALADFAAVEQLDGGERQYQCQSCNEKVRAIKQLSIHKPPHVLTIHLKRFSSVAPGEKIDKKVEFEPVLDLKPFSSDLYEGDLKYTLYGVLVHAGGSTDSGHYFCFIRTSSGMWHSLDDNKVTQVSEKTVLAQKAYMLFYVRDKSSAMKRSIDGVLKDSVPTNGLGNIVLPQSASGLNRSVQNGVGSKSESHSTINGHFISVTGNSLEHLIQKENSFQKNNKIMVKEALALENKEHVDEKETFISQDDTDILSNGLQQRTLQDPTKLSSSNDVLATTPLSDQVKEELVKLVQSKEYTCVSSYSNDATVSSENGVGRETYHLSNGCQVGVESVTLVAQLENSGILDPTPEKHAEKLLNENCILENDDAANDVIPDSGLTLPKMNRNDLSTKNKPISMSSQSNPMSGCTQQEALDTCLVKDQIVIFENEKGSSKSHCPRDGESLLNLEDTKLSNLPENLIATGLPKEVPEVTAADYSVHSGSQAPQKHNRYGKCSLRRGLHFGSRKLFFESLKPRKNKRHIKCRKRHTSYRNLARDELLEDDDMGTSTSEASGVVGGDCIGPPKISKSNSENGFRGRNGLDNSESYSMDSRDGDIDERSNKNGVTLATSNQSKRCSSSGLDQCDAPETDAHGTAPNIDGFMRLLMRGLKETTATGWDSAGSGSYQIRGVQNGSIGYVLDEWDTEYDRGKRKKVKKSGPSFSCPNPFQETANMSARQRLKSRMDQTSSGNQPFRI